MNLQEFLKYGKRYTNTKKDYFIGYYSNSIPVREDLYNKFVENVEIHLGYAVFW